VFWAFLITLVCVGIPVGGGIALAGWKMLLKSRPLEIDPMQVLAARFANGDLDEAEYLRKLALLTRGAAALPPGS
jgi:uncharacterized membrane protein